MEKLRKIGEINGWGQTDVVEIVKTLEKQGFPLLYSYSTELPMEEAFDEEKNLNNQGFFTYMEDIGRGQCKITVFIKDN